MGNPIRFTGLSSGLDTQSVVEALLTPYQSKINKVKANTTMAEWRKDAYKEMSLKLSNFRQKSASKLTNPNNFKQSKVTLSKEGAIKVDTSSYKKDASCTIEVKQLAQKATVSTRSIKSDSKLTSASKLSEIANNLNGKKLHIEGQSNALVIGENTTIADVENYLSGVSGVTCKFDESTQAFMMGAEDMNSASSIDLLATDGTVMKALGLGQNPDGTTTYVFDRTDAEVVYNGNLTVVQSSNDFEIDGVKFTAMSKTTEPITVSVERDVDTMVKNVTDFINEYNTLISEMSTKLYADSANKYQPLTEEEKDAMTEKEVETWENKIKSAIFRNDSTLRSLYNGIRSTMTGSYQGQEGISNEFNMLTQIGITSSSWSDRGKLKVDEEKLKKALSTNADDVANLLSKVANNINDQLFEASKPTNERSYNQFFNDKTLTTNISQYAKDLITAQEKYDRMETYYYKKFTAMETAYNKMNSQSSLFSSL